MYYSIDPIRREYLYYLFTSHKHIILDWPRQTGKTLLSLSCILDYAINNPNSNNLVIGHDNALINLKEKLLKYNQDKFNLIQGHSKYKISLLNGSTINFSKKITNEVFNTILIDEQGYTKINPFEFLRLNTKMIVNGTRTDSKVFENFVKEFGKLGHIVKYEKDLLSYLRLKKIEKLRTIILK
jgi:hypothetical protein